MKTVCIAAFYRFASLPQCASWREHLRQQMVLLDIKGTVLLAPEGINGTIAGSETAVNTLLETFGELDPQLEAIKPHRSWSETVPFARTKVKLKREIISFGVAELDPARNAGTYVEPENWNTLISDPEMLTIDTRNDYEVSSGSFAGAINPQIPTFRALANFVQQQLDPQKHKRVAMFCTGGIRCEKSTAYLRQLGFSEVFHLRGGILNYLDTVPAEQSLWEGECFVFDERVTLVRSSKTE